MAATEYQRKVLLHGLVGEEKVMSRVDEVKGSVQHKVTQKGKTYLYTVIYVPHLGKQKWEATGLEAKGNIRKAEIILAQRIQEYKQKEREIEEEQSKQGKEKVNPGDTIRFVDWMVNFIDSTKATVRKSTGEGYDMRLKHIVNYFSDKNIMLSQITAMDVDDFVKYLLMQGKVNRKTGERSGLAIRSVRSIKTLIVSALNKAVVMGYVKGNVALSVSVGKKSNTSLARKLNFMTLDELNDFLEYVERENDDMKDIIKIIAYYGLRRSEALGLYIGRDSIDLEHRRLHITRTVVKVDSIHDEDDTKSFDSDREFYITDEMMEFFQRVINKREEDKNFYGNTYIESKSLFTFEDGKPFEPDYLYHHFKSLMKKYGRENFTLHNLRHSCASYLVALGWDAKNIASWIGHADYNTTNRWYVVIDRAYKQKLTETLEGKIKI